MFVLEHLFVYDNNNIRFRIIRAAQIMNRPHRLKALQQQTPFDLLVIGGGATGCGIAVDAASRGLSVALIDKNDVAEGTSSRSTKLIHGGVRYLEMAVKKLDCAQYHLSVKDSTSAAPSSTTRRIWPAGWRW